METHPLFNGDSGRYIINGKRIFSDYEIEEAINHGPCMGCERCEFFATIPRAQIDNYEKRKGLDNGD